MADAKPPARETREERETRLQPVLDTLEAQGHAVFLDLCELVLLHSRKITGSIEWDHPRVVVKVRQIVTAERLAKRRGVELDPTSLPPPLPPPSAPPKKRRRSATTR